MESLRTYLATLEPEAQAAYAARAGTTIGYLRKALSVGQRFDGALVRLLDEESQGAVPRQSLRPDIWPPDEEPLPAPVGKRIDSPEAVAQAFAVPPVIAPADAAAHAEDPDATRVEPFEEVP